VVGVSLPSDDEWPINNLLVGAYTDFLLETFVFIIACNFGKNQKGTNWTL